MCFVYRVVYRPDTNENRSPPYAVSDSEILVACESFTHARAAFGLNPTGQMCKIFVCLSGNN